MSHDHEHNHQSGRNLGLAFFLNLGFTVIEIIGGLYVNSVAILSDAVHDLGDSLSLGLAWLLDRKSKQKADFNFSFGYDRFSVLGAFINSIILIIGGVYVIYQAILRLQNPEPVDADGMLLLAILGITINGYAAYKVSGGDSINEKVVSWHLMEDVLGWGAILIVSIVLQFVDLPILDPILSLMISFYILWGVSKRLKETIYVFLQGVPKEVDLQNLLEIITKINHVKSVHHTHLWSLDGQKHVFTSHVVLENISEYKEITACQTEINRIMKNYPFKHYTIQIELDDFSCDLIHDDEANEHIHETSSHLH